MWSRDYVPLDAITTVEVHIKGLRTLVSASDLFLVLSFKVPR
jgi:hypothetical protein